MDSIKNALEQVIQNAQSRAVRQSKLYRFDIFKGVEIEGGKIQKVRSVGSAQIMEGSKTYTVYLKTLLKDVFYLLPEQKRMTRGDYVILTREPSQTPGRKYFWNNVGECYVLDGENAGVMRLAFDLFGAGDIYMNLHPINREAEAVAAQDAAA